MKSSLGKLKRFAFQKTDGKDRRANLLPPVKLDELALASQEMLDMRNCYDSLLSAAAATTNSAYEFAESLRELGACLLEKTALYPDEESGKVLLMLGKVQFELQKLVDRYRSHIVLTITNPSESLLNELQTVEEMKQVCDEKRSVYEYMMAQQREKGRSKSGKGESFSSEQLQEAHNDYEEEATLCVFRLKSLKQGQARSLLTQAARHHTSQLNFFRKGLKSLEAVDPLVQQITEKQHIDYQLSGVDDGENGEDDGDNGYDSNDDGELSSDYRQPKPTIEAVSASRNSMELDQEDQSFPKTSTVASAEVRVEKAKGDSEMLEAEPRSSSHSAPILAEKKFDPAERIKQIQPSTRKFHTYVLPTPVDAKRNSTSVPRTRPTSLSGDIHNIWHSSPLESKMHKSDSKENALAYPTKSYSVSDDGNISRISMRLPPPIPDAPPFTQNETVDASDHKKVKRQAFSGPLSNKPRLTRPDLPANGPIVSSEIPQVGPGSIAQLSAPQPSSPKASTSILPSSISPPKVSELHELPRPPRTAPNKTAASLGFSAPLAPGASETSAKSRSISAASPLPIPPLTVPRSFSIPSSKERSKALQVTKLLGSPKRVDKAENMASPPLTPISLVNANVGAATPKARTQADES